MSLENETNSNEIIEDSLYEEGESEFTIEPVVDLVSLSVKLKISIHECNLQKTFQVSLDEDLSRELGILLIESAFVLRVNKRDATKITQ